MKHCLIFMSLFLFSGIVFAADDNGIVYLKCDADAEYKVNGPQILIDKKKHSLAIAPFETELPVIETATHFGTEIRHKNETLFEIAVNRHTLRYRLFNSLNIVGGLPQTTTGQCSIVDKKL